MKNQNKKIDKKYSQYNDYAFKKIVLERSDGLLKFMEIPYSVERMISSELTDIDPKIHRLDFAGTVLKDDEEISLILEFQSNLPTDDDITRFFQYASSLRIINHKKVELYIICLKDVSYVEKKYVLNDDCVYTMKVVSLKNYEAKEIFKTVENKLKNNEQITDEDIAALQLVIYTNYTESKLEIVKRAQKLIDKIVENSFIDVNEKIAIYYLFDLLSANMLNDNELEEYMEEHTMIINPRERYFHKKGIEEGKKEGIEEGIEEGKKEGIEEGKLDVARNLFKKGFDVDEIAEVTEMPRNKLQNYLYN